MRLSKKNKNIWAENINFSKLQPSTTRRIPWSISSSIFQIEINSFIPFSPRLLFVQPNTTQCAISRLLNKYSINIYHCIAVVNSNNNRTMLSIAVVARFTIIRYIIKLLSIIIVYSRSWTCTWFMLYKFLFFFFFFYFNQRKMKSTIVFILSVSNETNSTSVLENILKS